MVAFTSVRNHVPTGLDLEKGMLSVKDVPFLVLLALAAPPNALPGYAQAITLVIQVDDRTLIFSEPPRLTVLVVTFTLRNACATRATWGACGAWGACTACGACTA